MNIYIRKKFLALVLFSGVISAAPEDDFVLTIKTDIVDPENDQFTVSTIGSDDYYFEGEDFNYNIDCNNDGVNEGESLNSGFTCDYSQLGGPGTYTIRIMDNRGDGTGFPQFSSKRYYDSLLITSLDQWGTGKWVSMAYSFWAAKNMEVNATDVPNLSNVRSTHGMFLHASKANPNVTEWDVSSVLDMDQMFDNATSANPDVSNWDVSSAQSMAGMFAWAYSANPDVKNWDVSNVTNMNGMFSHAKSADPDVSDWNVSNVMRMSSVFEGTNIANPDVSKWDVSKVLRLDYMFRNTKSANPDVSEWNTKSVVSASGMFEKSTVANPDVSGWDTSSLLDTISMFQDATSASPDISNWNVSNVSNFWSMFNGISLKPKVYDSILESFSKQPLRLDDFVEDAMFDAGNSFYCEGADAKAQIISGYNWEILDSGLNCGKDATVTLKTTEGSPNKLDLVVSNTGFQFIDSAKLTTNTISDSVYDISWACETISGDIACPESSGFGDIDQLINLDKDDSLKYTINYVHTGDEVDYITKTQIDLLGSDIYSKDNFDSVNHNGAKISKDFTGAWFNPASDGQGLFFEYMESETNKVVAYWFTHQDTKPIWLSGVGEVDEENKLTIDLYHTVGGELPSSINFNPPVLNYWGKVQFELNTQNHLKMEWNSTDENLTGEMELIHLARPSHSFAGCFSGSFINSDHPSQGLFIYVNDSSNSDKQLNVSWFTHENGEQLWLVGSAEYKPNQELNFNLTKVTGGNFFDNNSENSWNTYADGLTYSDWGEGALQFDNTNQMSFKFTSFESNGDSYNYEMPMERLTPNVSTCQ